MGVGQPRDTADTRKSKKRKKREEDEKGSREKEQTQLLQVGSEGLDGSGRASVDHWGELGSVQGAEWFKTACRETDDPGGWQVGCIVHAASKQPPRCSKQRGKAWGCLVCCPVIGRRQASHNRPEEGELKLARPSLRLSKHARAHPLANQWSQVAWPWPPSGPSLLSAWSASQCARRQHCVAAPRPQRRPHRHCRRRALFGSKANMPRLSVESTARLVLYRTVRRTYNHLWCPRLLRLDCCSFSVLVSPRLPCRPHRSAQTKPANPKTMRRTEPWAPLLQDSMCLLSPGLSPNALFAARRRRIKPFKHTLVGLPKFLAAKPNPLPELNLTSASRSNSASQRLSSSGHDCGKRASEFQLALLFNRQFLCHKVSPSRPRPANSVCCLDWTHGAKAPQPAHSARRWQAVPAAHHIFWPA